MVVVNLYPFEEMSNTSDLSLDKLIEYIDVGGPSMLSAAAKNFQSVITLCSPCMYEDFMIEFSKNSGKFDYDTRKRYAKTSISRNIKI